MTQAFCITVTRCFSSTVNNYTDDTYPIYIFSFDFSLLFIALKEVNTKAGSNVDPKKVSIVYLSRTSNTKAIAEMIQNSAGRKLVALELEKPYLENYQATF